MRYVWLVLTVAAVALAALLWTRFEGTPPVIDTLSGPFFVGEELRHTLHVNDEGMGVESVRVWVESNDVEVPILEREFPGSLLFGATLELERSVEVTVRPADLGIADGRATLWIEARDFSWRGNRTTDHVSLVIDTRAPLIGVETGLTYIRRGGAEAAVYRIDEAVVSHGVRAGDAIYPGYPHPSDPTRWVALYPLSPDRFDGWHPEVFAVDRAGNESRVPLTVSVIERSFPIDEIRLTDSFLARKVPEILGKTDGPLIDRYLELNGELRRKNADTIRAACGRNQERMWAGAFIQLPNSKVGAGFAEQRTYTYGGREVDQQVHLGYDLASVAHAPVPAANHGTVAFAGELGIYGQAVVIDHGLGVCTLYGHLSEIGVEQGQSVIRGDVIGATGSTGLAGGDHLHFAVMVGDEFVDPLEWFDAKWIAEHLQPKL